MIDEDAYESAVNAQWLKLAHAESNDELKEVLSTWPSPKDFEIEAQSADGHKEQDENSTDSSSEERE